MKGIAMVQHVRDNWWKWVLSGTPAAIAVIVPLLLFSAQIGDMRTTIHDLKESQPATEQRLNSLDEQIQGLKIQVQRLEDELEFEHRVYDTPIVKKGIDYPQNMAGSEGMR